MLALTREHTNLLPVRLDRIGIPGGWRPPGSPAPPRFGRTHWPLLSTRGSCETVPVRFIKYSHGPDVYRRRRELTQKTSADEYFCFSEMFERFRVGGFHGARTVTPQPSSGSRPSNLWIRLSRSRSRCRKSCVLSAHDLLQPCPVHSSTFPLFPVHICSSSEHDCPGFFCRSGFCCFLPRNGARMQASGRPP